MLNNRVVLNVERPKSIALIDHFILARFSGHQILGEVYHKTPTSSNPLSRNQRLNPESSSVFASLMFKKAYIGQYSGFRPDWTALRKTPRGWLPSNKKRKDHAGSVLIARKECKGPFLSRGL